jgi:hypothetical protein
MSIFFDDLPIDPKMITRILLDDSDGGEIRLSYYTPDEISRQNAYKIQERLQGKNPEDLEGYIVNYEEEYDLDAQDTFDKHGNRIAAKIFAAEDGTKQFYHFQRGEFFMLYSLAYAYIIDGSGNITSSMKLEEYEQVDNNEQENAHFDHTFKFYQNKHKMQNEVRKKADATTEITQQLIKGMGLN